MSRLGAELDTPVRALSKGNRQKLGLIQAFMSRPRVLLGCAPEPSPAAWLEAVRWRVG